MCLESCTSLELLSQRIISLGSHAPHAVLSPLPPRELRSARTALSSFLGSFRKVVFSEETCSRRPVRKPFLRRRAGEASRGWAAKTCCFHSGLCCTTTQLLVDGQGIGAAGSEFGLLSVCALATELSASSALPTVFYSSKNCCSSHSLAQTVCVIETQNIPNFLFSQPTC